MKNKVLIISYYWPPSGGAGVQRWLNASKYMVENGVEVHVLTVDPEKASYLQIDEHLSEAVHPDLKVYHTNSFEPIKIYSRIVGKSKVPNAGYANIKEYNRKQKWIAKIRSHFFIPDPRIGWKRYGYKKAIEIIKKEKITNIITTSTPHSVQLIGLQLKRELKDQMNWIADFRDPWTDIYYYPLLQHSKWSHRRNLNYEKQVLEETDSIITVGESLVDFFMSKSQAIKRSKFDVITNSYDDADFKDSNTISPSSTVFSIGYIGTMADNYEPEVFFEVLSRLIKNHPESSIHFTLTGTASDGTTERIYNFLDDNVTFVPPVSHHLAIEAMLKSHLLLLITPGEKAPIPGKIFEYLASGRQVICIGKGDSAEILNKFKGGKAFQRSEKESIYSYLNDALLNFNKGIDFKSDTEAIRKISWRNQAKRIIDLLK